MSENKLQRMREVRGGSYAVGTTSTMVQLSRYTGPDGTGEQVISITMPPHEARMIGRALLEQADEPRRAGTVRMSEYWTPLERLLSLSTAVVNPEQEIPRMLVEQHFVLPENEQAVRELLSYHPDTYVEDPDDEHNFYCRCGKWLERDQYDLPDHQASLLDDAGLLIREEGPQRPPRASSTTPAPAAFQFPRREITMDWETP